MIAMFLQSFHDGFCWKLLDKTSARPMAPLGSTAIFRISVAKPHSFYYRPIFHRDHSIHKIPYNRPGLVSEGSSEPISNSICLRQCHYFACCFRKSSIIGSNRLGC
uniref:Uncharacterized protein n=1 Tax=Opuntia streptacantha TaxID=393608 RepID=A0A7C9EIY2_OPUST